MEQTARPGSAIIHYLDLDKALDLSKSRLLAWKTEVVPVAGTGNFIQQLHT